MLNIPRRGYEIFPSLVVFLLRCLGYSIYIAATTLFRLLINGKLVFLSNT
jgi:hypothetical protein